jgi:hypothetical protein
LRDLTRLPLGQFRFSAAFFHLLNLSRRDLCEVSEGSQSRMAIALEPTFNAPAAPNFFVRGRVEKKIVRKTWV